MSLRWVGSLALVALVGIGAGLALLVVALAVLYLRGRPRGDRETPS